MLTEAAMNPKKNREKLVECMFETFGFDGVHCSIQAVLTLYAQASTEISPIVSSPPVSPLTSSDLP